MIADQIPSKAKLHCCAGMRRSGSTLQAQIVAHLLGDVELTAPDEATFGARFSDPSKLDSSVVIKCHRFIPEVAAAQQRGEAKILYTYRDLRDVVASIMVKYGIPAKSFIHGGVRSILEEDRAWSKLPGVHMARYESVMRDLRAEVVRLGGFLGVELSSERSSAVAEEFGVEKQRMRIAEAIKGRAEADTRDPNARVGGSLLHLNHIHSGRSGSHLTVLKWFELAAVEWECHHWLRQHNYAPVYSRSVQALCRFAFFLRAVPNRFLRALGSRTFRSHA